MKEMKSKAKEKMLRELSREMLDMMGSPMGEKLQKVTVASDSPEGLEKGLSKAEEILKQRQEMLGEEGMEEEMLEEELDEDEDELDLEEEELDEDEEQMAEELLEEELDEEDEEEKRRKRI